MTTLPSIDLQPLIPLPTSESHTRLKKPRRGSIAQPQPIHPLAHANLLDEADNTNRFATLFMPATPPATPTPIFRDQHPTSTLPQHHRHRTISAESDSEFGAFVSVPPAQDPLSFDYPVAVHPTSLLSSNASLHYFDQFTSNAKTSSDLSRRTVLDELLEHEDDPLYFVHRQPSTPPIAENRSASPQVTFVESSLPSVESVSQSGDLIDTDVKFSSPPPKLPVCTPSIPSQSPVTARTPLPPRLSGASSPPSLHTVPTSVSSLPLSSSTPPAQAALSRLSSSWVSSLLPSARSKHSTGPPSSTSTIVHSPPGPMSTSPSHIHIARPTLGITRGTPFASHPYIPPSGAPGFAGDRIWDKGFSDSLEDEEMCEVKGGLGKANKGKGKQAKGVNLVGRRDGTLGVLNDNIANLVRFCSFHRSTIKFIPICLDSSTSPGTHSSPTNVDAALLARPARYFAKYTLFPL